MALIHGNIMSKELHRQTAFNAVIPVDVENISKCEFPTLYLLHGLSDNCEAWVANSRIVKLAEEAGIAVIMPTGDISFYIDQLVSNNNYGKFVGEELVDITRKMFPLSSKREDTIIGGLSMGGFGAIRNGLKYHETFGSIIALSSALHIFETPDELPIRETPYDEDLIFGDLDVAKESDRNPAYILNNLKKEEIPEIFMACGTEDNLIYSNRCFKERLLKKGADLTYIEAPGEHVWSFWDEYIEKGIKWFNNKRQ